MTCTRGLAWARLMFRPCRQHRKHGADCRRAQCVGCGNTWKCIWAKVSICRCWLELPDYQYIILHDNLSNPPGDPHVYLTQKRVERAQEMLVQTDLPLAEIAFAVGFFDQGHLARHFRHLLGKTLREFRWSQR